MKNHYSIPVLLFLFFSIISNEILAQAQSLLDQDFIPNARSGVTQTVVQPDGKIVVTGAFSSIGGVTRNGMARLNPNGTLDTGFNPDVNGSISALALQEDGKLLIGGRFSRVGGVARENFARLNSNGTLDTGVNIAPFNQVRAIALQADGKFLISTRGFTATLVRYNANGTVDTGFTPVIEGQTIETIELQSNGKIVIGGRFTKLNGVDRGNIARLNSNGQIDTSFVPVFVNDEVLVVKIQSDGKVLLGGRFSEVAGATRNRLARLNSNGSLEVGFNPNMTGGFKVNAIELQENGGILVGGDFTGAAGLAYDYLVRLDENGIGDSAFNPSLLLNDEVRSIAVQSDQKIVIGGEFTFLAQNRLQSLLRLNPNSSAVINVNAQVGEAGCDLIDAINSANNNAVEGGCVALGEFGNPDFIYLSPASSDNTFTVTQAINPSDPNNDETAFPFIRSHIVIEGQNPNGLVGIARDTNLSTPDFRFFKVLDNAILTLSNISLENGRLLPTVSDPGGATGGAIRLNANAELNLENCELRDNTARAGGALSIERSSQVTIRKCSLIRNQAVAQRTMPNGNSYIGGRGGAIQYREGGRLTVLDSTISNNFSGFDGAISLAGPNMFAAFYNTTITQNFGSLGNTISDDAADSGGGISYFPRVNDDDDSNALTVVNSIISGNAFPSSPFEDEGFEIASSNLSPGTSESDTRLINNIIGQSGQRKATSLRFNPSRDELVFTGSGNIFPGSDQATPMTISQILLPLRLNGGSTQTHALPENSPAIDAGVDNSLLSGGFFNLFLPGCRGEELQVLPPALPPFRSDQRGIARPINGACDIGAFEGTVEQNSFFVIPIQGKGAVIITL